MNDMTTLKLKASPNWDRAMKSTPRPPSWEGRMRFKKAIWIRFLSFTGEISKRSLMHPKKVAVWIPAPAPDSDPGFAGMTFVVNLRHLAKLSFLQPH